MFVPLSYCQHVSGCRPLDKSPRNFILVTSEKIYLENINLLSTQQKYRAIFINTYVRFILLAVMYVTEQKIEDIFAVPNKEYSMFYTVDGDIYTSTKQTIQLAHCCVSLATMFAQRNLDVTFYIHRRSHC